MSEQKHGFELSRFPSLTRSEADELTCGICLLILYRPLVTPCCQLAYCEGCIKAWIQTNATCPNDRKPLSAERLQNPQRAFVNMLGKLQIRCSFEGCKEVLLLDNLHWHEDKCPFNPEGECETCCLPKSKSPTHDCIQSLKDAFAVSKDAITALRKNNLDLVTENKSMSSLLSIAT